MAVQIIMKLHIAIALLLLAVLVASHDTPRPTNLGRSSGESPGNLTIDQIIANARKSGGPEGLTGPNGQVLVELDMWLTKDQYDTLYSDEGGRSRRKAARDVLLRWTNKTIPYRYYTEHFSPYDQYWIRRAMTDWERYTCINFRPATKNDTNWARFQNGDGCDSQLGMIGGKQDINLDENGCRFKGLYLHETGHAIGLYHEHQVPQRDDYIWIDWRNVMPGWEDSFTKYGTALVDNMGVKYDYSSIMHYGVTAFSKDGKSQTIHARYADKEGEIGRVYLKELAWSDVAVVNKMYQCGAHCPDQDKCGADGVLDENCRCICKDGSHDTCDKTITPDTSCVNEDTSWNCYIWANEGECDRNPTYMKKHCKKSCQVCGGPQPSPSSPCKNQYLDKKCNMWAKRGDCVTNKWWMTQNCPVACKYCTQKDTAIQESCQNKHSDLEQCNEWATDGECVINPDGMFLNCKKSCLACNNTGGHIGFGDTEIATADTRPPDNYDCDDKHAKCLEWAASQECDKNPDFMMYNCRKACGKCEDGTCKNIYTDLFCMWWAQEGACRSNPVWMARNCAKACRVCNSKVTKPATVWTTPSVPPGCVNKYGNDHSCDMWAKGGQCETNPSFMKRQCARSCGTCTPDVTTPKPIDGCTDQHSSCPKWAENGDCDSSRASVALKECQLSCNNCGCRDERQTCEAWARNNGCYQNARYMMRHCQKACKVC